MAQYVVVSGKHSRIDSDGSRRELRAGDVFEAAPAAVAHLGAAIRLLDSSTPVLPEMVQPSAAPVATPAQATAAPVEEPVDVEEETDEEDEEDPEEAEEVEEAPAEDRLVKRPKAKPRRAARKSRS